MGKKKSIVSINRDGDTIKLEIKDQTYRVVHRGVYRVNVKADLYNLLTTIEKYTPYTINQIINWKNSWI